MLESISQLKKLWFPWLLDLEKCLTLFSTPRTLLFVQAPPQQKMKSERPTTSDRTFQKNVSFVFQVHERELMNTHLFDSYCAFSITRCFSYPQNSQICSRWTWLQAKVVQRSWTSKGLNIHRLGNFLCQQTHGVPESLNSLSKTQTSMLLDLWLHNLFDKWILCLTCREWIQAVVDVIDNVGWSRLCPISGCPAFSFRLPFFQLKRCPQI